MLPCPQGFSRNDHMEGQAIELVLSIRLSLPGLSEVAARIGLGGPSRDASFGERNVHRYRHPDERLGPLGSRALHLHLQLNGVCPNTLLGLLRIKLPN